MKNEKNPDRNGVPPPFPAGENLSPGLAGNPLPGVPGRGTAFPARGALKRALRFCRGTKAQERTQSLKKEGLFRIPGFLLRRTGEEEVDTGTGSLLARNKAHAARFPSAPPLPALDRAHFCGILSKPASAPGAHFCNLFPHRTP